MGRVTTSADNGRKSYDVSSGTAYDVNPAFNTVLPDLGLRRVLAQVDVDFSNSLIEALWRSMKHRWLFLHSLTTFDAATKLVDEYVRLHNAVIPHSAFGGRTPDEAFVGAGGDDETRLAERRMEARRIRIESNRRASCGACRPADTPEAREDGEERNPM